MTWSTTPKAKRFLSEEEPRDNFGLTAAERYGPRNAYAWIIVSERNGVLQHGTTYYARQEDAEADANWYRRWNLPGSTYAVERVRTSTLCLTHKSRIPELEKARSTRMAHEAFRKRVSALVGRGVPYSDAVMRAKGLLRRSA